MINLDKGQKISLDKEYGGILRRIRLGVGWYPAGYIPMRFRKDTNETAATKETSKPGFFGIVGNLISGKGRIGDVVNSAVDSGKGLVNKAVDYIDGDYEINRNLSNYVEKLEDIDVDLSVAFYSKGNLIAKVFWHHDYQSAFSGAVRHSGDNRTGKPKCQADMEKDKEYITIDLKKLPAEVDEFVQFVQIYDAHIKGQDFGMVGGGFARLSNEDEIVDGVPKEMAFFNLTDDYKDKGIQGLYLTRFYRYRDDWRMETLATSVKYAPYVDDMLKQYTSLNA